MIKNLLKEGFALKNKGHYKHAIEVFYKALEEDNTSTELLLEIADLYYKLGNEEKALSYIEQILDEEPSHIQALKLLEHIFISKNALAEAEQTAKNIYCFSENICDLAEILKILNKEGKFQEVFEYKIKTPNNEILKEQAKALFYSHKFEEAENTINMLDDKDTESLILLAKLLYAQKKKDDCLNVLNLLPEIENNSELFNLRGLISEYQKNYKLAKEYFLKAIKNSPNNDEYHFNIANFYFRQGDVTYAKKYYNIAISIKPENKNYHFALANLYYSEQHYKRALEELEDDFFEGNLLKAIILYDTGYLALAKRELNKLAQEDPNNKIIQEYTEKIHIDLGLN